MARSIYTIEPSERQKWRIAFDGLTLGPYRSATPALVAAIDLAFGRGRLNPDGAQVRQKSGRDQFDVKWTCGIDPYPYEPPGEEPIYRA
jgi:hypothetical protein